MSDHGFPQWMHDAPAPDSRPGDAPHLHGIVAAKMPTWPSDVDLADATLCREHFSKRRDNEEPPICEDAWAKCLYPCDFRTPSSETETAPRNRYANWATDLLVDRVRDYAMNGCSSRNDADLLTAAAGRLDALYRGEEPNALEAANARIRELEAEPRVEWRTIETAPRGAGYVLCWSSEWEMPGYYWWGENVRGHGPGRWYEVGEAQWVEEQPTHWVKLAAPFTGAIDG